jgi:AhpD family alkylhydroperoxidase
MSETPIVEARVPLIEIGEVAPEAVPLYEKLLADRGCVPNMFKALGNVPALALGIAAMLKPLLGEGALPAWYKELIATRAALLNRCDYCVSAHRYLALQRGATPEQIASIGEAGADSFEAGPFTEKEKAGFRYAGLLHISGHSIDDAAYSAVSTHFNPSELIELTAVAAAFQFFPRLTTALRIPVTPLPSSE